MVNFPTSSSKASMTAKCTSLHIPRRLGQMAT
jgi:hypothetical protein